MTSSAVAVSNTMLMKSILTDKFSCVAILHYSFRMPRFFAGYKLHFFLYLSQFLGTMTCIRRAVLHIRPLRTPKGVPFLPVSAPFLTLTSLVRLVAKRNSPVRNPIFSLIVHAYSCYQSENIYSICLLKRVIDPSVLNHSI